MNWKYILIVIILAVIVGGGILAYQYWWLPKEEAKISGTKLPEVKAPEEVPPGQATSGTEKASGIIKSVYSKSGKNYIDIDYVELNPNWAPGGMSGQAFQNNNPKIRTFEISPSAKFVVGSPATISVTFSEFQKFFTTSDTSVYQKYNPWDIVVTDGVVVEITEHFLP